MPVGLGYVTSLSNASCDDGDRPSGQAVSRQDPKRRDVGLLLGLSISSARQRCGRAPFAAFVI